MDGWTAHRALKEFLDLLPMLVAFVIGGLYTLAMVLLTRKAAKKRWDADFMSRYKEEARCEIRERDAFIAGLEEQLKDAQRINQELARRTKAAVILSGKASEVLLTTDFTPMSRVGFESPERQLRTAERRNK